MIQIRPATGHDAPAIREIFLATYGTTYPTQRFYDVDQLQSIIYSDDNLILVAEDPESKQILGTASVLLQVGAYSDLIGEFGRLAVHPDARNQGAGQALMKGRLARVQDRLHVGLIEARIAHPYSLKIAERNGFSVIGLLPLRLELGHRESLTLLARHFGDGPALRKNHPRIIPEAYAVASLALENCRLPVDVIVDEESPPFPCCGDFELQELTADGYSTLLRIERGRVRRREIFGPMRLHYGFFRIQATQSRYLIARDHGRIMGAVGFTVDPVEHNVKVFELITLNDEVVRFLLDQLLLRCSKEHHARYVEIDVSAYAPHVQRTLLELGFLPVAYVPSMVFHDVERLDVLRMAVLLGTPELEPLSLQSPKAQEMAEVVLKLFQRQQAQPLIAQALQSACLFAGLTEEQAQRVAGICEVRKYPVGARVFVRDAPADEMHVLLDGEAEIRTEDASPPIGHVQKGECLGEVATLTAKDHSATATVTQPMETVTISATAFHDLIRFRPDVGLLLYRNLAVGLGSKLLRSDRELSCRAS